ISGGIGQDKLNGGDLFGDPFNPLSDGLDTIAAVDPANGNTPDNDTLGGGALSDIIAVDAGDALPFFTVNTTPINGTSGADIIILTQSATQISVEVNGKVTPFGTDELFTVDAKGGNDLIVLSKSD